jgi:hypothetical protein
MTVYKYDKARDEVVCISDSVGRGSPDVYFKEPYFDPNIASPNHPGHENGTFIESRMHKAMLMKKFDIREAGDARHGSRNFDPIAHRHAMESLRRKR